MHQRRIEDVTFRRALDLLDAGDVFADNGLLLCKRADQMNTLPENATDEQRLKSYLRCLQEQGFDTSGLVDLTGDLASVELPGLTKDLAQTMFQSAQNGQGCAALLTQAQREQILRNKSVCQREDGYDKKVDTKPLS